jgi:hypothetical protein
LQVDIFSFWHGKRNSEKFYSSAKARFSNEDRNSDSANCYCDDFILPLTDIQINLIELVDRLKWIFTAIHK